MTDEPREPLPARHALLLHGGAGPASVAPLADRLAATYRVLAPTHPGWDGTPRPAALSSVDALAVSYLALLEQSDLRDVVVVGSSFGGWVASRLALDDTDSRIAALVLVDAIGPDVPGHSPRAPEVPPPDAAPPRTVGGGPPPTPADLAALRAYTGGAFTDPSLLADLARVRVPVLVIWGEDDRVVGPDFGRAYAAAFPDARFELLRGVGHLPVRDAPDAVAAAIDAFVPVGPPAPRP